MLAAVAGAQLAAARGADDYTRETLTAQGIASSSEGVPQPGAVAGVASDGRPLETLIAWPAIVALILLRAGASEARALGGGRASLDMIVRTQVADAGRASDAVALANRGGGGYTRMTVGATCGRCMVLSGKFFGWNKGFQRHPRCDCVHVPTDRAHSRQLVTDPRRRFYQMSPAEQDRAFGKAGAEAIRAGADIGQVVNAQRGMQTAQVFGRQLQVTTEGMTQGGIAGRRLGETSRGIRLMPEEILRQANGNRDEAIRLLRRYGYIL